MLWFRNGGQGVLYQKHGCCNPHSNIALERLILRRIRIEFGRDPHRKRDAIGRGTLLGLLDALNDQSRL